MLKIAIPDDIDNQLSSVTNDKEKFIITAIKQKIAAKKKTIYPEDLAKEYADSIDENKLIAQDFIHVDNDHWDDY